MSQTTTTPTNKISDTEQWRDAETTPAPESNWLNDTTQAVGKFVLDNLGRFKAAAKAFIRPQLETADLEIHDITTWH